VLELGPDLDKRSELRAVEDSAVLAEDEIAAIVGDAVMLHADFSRVMQAEGTDGRDGDA
jgi:hypothetical protein